MMKPYPGQNLTLAERVFNYRLSRARRVIENCFGVATSRFRVFRKPIIARSLEDTHIYCPLSYTDQESSAGQQAEEWREENEGMVSISHISSNNYSKSAKIARDDYKEYFNSQQGASAGKWVW